MSDKEFIRGIEIANADVLFNVLTSLEPSTRAQFIPELSTGLSKGVVLSFNTEKDKDGEYVATLHFGADRLKKATDRNLVNEINNSPYGYFRTWEHIFQLLSRSTPAERINMEIYAFSSNLRVGRICICKNKFIFTYSNKHIHRVVQNEKDKAEFDTFMKKALEPVSDIDYGESYD